MVAAEEKALIPIETRALAEFSVSPEDVAARVEEFRDLHLTPADPKSYKQVKNAYMVLVHLRNGVDRRRKELGEEARKWTNALSAAAKKLIDPTVALENRLKAELDAEDARVAAIERARVDAITAKIADIQKRGFVSPATTAAELQDLFLDTFEMDITEADFQEFYAEAIQRRDQVIAVLKDAITKREAWEKGEAERKAEAERLEKIRKEQEVERQALEAEKRKLQEEKDQIEALKRAEAEAKAKAERDAKEKEERERKVKEAADYAERIQPDKKKIISWVHGILDHPRPEMKEKESKELLGMALHELVGWAEVYISEAEKL